MTWTSGYRSYSRSSSGTFFPGHTDSEARDAKRDEPETWPGSLLEKPLGP